MTVEAMEARLDEIAAEALRRKAQQLDRAKASKTDRAAAMAKARAEVTAWRSRATAAALLAAANQ